MLLSARGSSLSIDLPSLVVVTCQMTISAHFNNKTEKRWLSPGGRPVVVEEVDGGHPGRGGGGLG